MSNAVVTLNYSEVGNLLKSDEVMAELNAQADAIIGRCSGNYEKSEYVGKKRANVAIMTTDEETFHSNLNNNELLKALGGSK